MKKEFWFVIVLALLFCVGFFIYCVLTYEEELSTEEEFIGVETEKPQYYELKEKDTEKFLVNKHAGFSLKVPDKWRVEKLENAFSEWIVNLMSPDAEINNSMLKKGCGVSIWVEYDPYGYSYILNEIKNPEAFRENLEHIRYEKITVEQRPGLKIVGESEKIGKILFIKIPYKENTVLFLDTRIIPEYSYCEDIFNQIIQSIKFLES